MRLLWATIVWRILKFSLTLGHFVIFSQVCLISGNLPSVIMRLLYDKEVVCPPEAKMNVSEKRPIV